METAKLRRKAGIAWLRLVESTNPDLSAPLSDAARQAVARICAHITEDRLLVLGQRHDPDRVVAAAEAISPSAPGTAVGIGLPRPGLSGAVDSITDATQALSQAGGQHRVVRFADIRTELAQQIVLDRLLDLLLVLAIRSDFRRSTTAPRWYRGSAAGRRATSHARDAATRGRSPNSPRSEACPGPPSHGCSGRHSASPGPPVVLVAAAPRTFALIVCAGRPRAPGSTLAMRRAPQQQSVDGPRLRNPTGHRTGRLSPFDGPWPRHRGVLPAATGCGFAPPRTG